MTSSALVARLLGVVPPGLCFSTGSILLLVLFAVCVALLVVLIRAGLWNSSGSILDFVAGQFEPRPRHLEKGASLDGGGAHEPFAAQITVDLQRPVAEVSERYLSFAIDMSQVVGGRWWDPRAARVEMGSGTVHAPVFDFDRPKLDLLVRALAPAYLRIGGSESDKVYYDVQGGREPQPSVPQGYESVLTGAQWDAVNRFAARNGLQVVFTLNAGPAARAADGRWNEGNASDLMAYTARQGYPVTVWELGNELNTFWYVHGLRSQVSPERYHRDLQAARALLAQILPGARLAGQGSAFWPVLGETLSLFFGFFPAYLERAGDVVDVLTWHYYPQQSRRGPMASRRAFSSRLLDARNLDEAAYWAEKIRGWRDQHAPGKPIWLGETGNAQFGGEPGLSDVYLGGLWWLDQLGLLARSGHDVVIRQTLSGSDYGMIEDGALDPRPDYWNSLLWKRLMGRRVYAAGVAGEHRGKLRVYAHATASAESGSLTVLLVNLDHRHDAIASFPGFEGSGYELFAVNTPDIFGTTVLLNGAELGLRGDQTLPAIRGVWHEGAGVPAVRVHPLSYAFVVFPRR